MSKMENSVISELTDSPEILIRPQTQMMTQRVMNHSIDSVIKPDHLMSTKTRDLMKRAM